MLILATVFCADGSGAQGVAGPTVSDVVLFGITSPNELNAAVGRADSTTCVQRYLAAIPPDSWLWRVTAPLSHAEAVAKRRQNLIEQITVIHGEATRQAASSFAAAIPLLGEWEGEGNGPLAEARAAERWLERNADAPITAFVHLFMAHRFRAGYEIAVTRGGSGISSILGEKYIGSLSLARESDNYLISCIAGDLAARSFVYLEDQRHGQASRGISVQEGQICPGYPYFDERFSGRVEAGADYARPFGGRFEFVLDPMTAGWTIRIRELGRLEDLARLTPPLHGAVNPREIEGWQLLERVAECAALPYQEESGPPSLRRFIFSPEVGKSIDGIDAKRSVTVEDVGAVERFGRGEFRIDAFELGAAHEGCPGIKWMTFSVWLTGGCRARTE